MFPSPSPPGKAGAAAGQSVAKSESRAPKDALLFTLAGIYEQTGASADARATYQRLITDYPNSPYRADARQKVPLS